MLRFLTDFISVFQFFNGFQFPSVFAAEFRKTLKRLDKLVVDTQPAFTCSKPKIEKLEKGEKYTTKLTIKTQE